MLTVKECFELLLFSGCWSEHTTDCDNIQIRFQANYHTRALGLAALHHSHILPYSVFYLVEGNEALSLLVKHHIFTVLQTGRSSHVHSDLWFINLNKLLLPFKEI